MDKMNSATLFAPGDLRYVQVDKPEIKNSNDVLVRIKSAGICGSDLDRVLFKGTYHFPTIPGHEFSGVVEDAGEAVTTVIPGSRVVVAPMIPCMNCANCAKGNYGQCVNYDFIGSRRDGAFTEYVIVPERNILVMPDEVSFDEGAIVEPAAVTLHGMKKVGINPGDFVAVLGCGPIGQIAIQLARIMGATKIAAVDVVEGKLTEAKGIGADYIINSMKDDPVKILKELTGGNMADVVIETAGSPITQEQCFRAGANLGRVLFLGTAHKDINIPAESFEMMVRGELSMVGSWNSYSAPFPGVEWRSILEYLASGLLNLKALISHRFPMEQAPLVFGRLKNREFAYNKILFFNA